MQDYIYLDHAATTPMDERVLQAMQPYFTTQFYNPSALYEPALSVAKAMNEARASVAHWLGARQTEVVFTAGGTESANLAIYGVMRAAGPGANLVTTAIEHDAVLEPARHYSHKLAKVDKHGLLDVDDLKSKIDENTALVSVMYANNEVGTVQPIKRVAQVVAEERLKRGKQGKPIYLHTDACQAGNYLDLHAARLGADLITLNGGKVYGPKQSGCLFIKTGTNLEPLISGGGQEFGVRSGTPNVPYIMGFARALDLAQDMRKAESDRLHALQQRFVLQAEQSGLIVNGHKTKRLPNNVHITVPGADNERLLLQLEQRHILASAGSACSASDDTSSHVLLAMGLTDDDARSSLRFSLGRGTSETEIDTTVHAILSLR